MLLSVISPETFVPHEAATLPALFAAGLERYHVRKPNASAPELEDWLRHLDPQWRDRMILHSHHHLVDTLRLCGRHERDRSFGRDDAVRQAPAAAVQLPPRRSDGHRPLLSCACHDLAALGQALPHCDLVLLSPVFPSLSKPGYGPSATFDLQDPEQARELRAILDRPAGSSRAKVFALGGIAPDRVAACRALGFDGVAVLGAIWHAPDPPAAFRRMQAACRHAATTVMPTAAPP